MGTFRQTGSELLHRYEVHLTAITLYSQPHTTMSRKNAVQKQTPTEGTMKEDIVYMHRKRRLARTSVVRQLMRYLLITHKHHGLFEQFDRMISEVTKDCVIHAHTGDKH